MDYCHKLGLKFGIYADYGTHTCAGYPGTTPEYFKTDAETFSDWGVDYVKMDGCNSDPASMDTGFTEFGAALAETGRDMVYQCEWPLYQVRVRCLSDYLMIKLTRIIMVSLPTTQPSDNTATSGGTTMMFRITGTVSRTSLTSTLTTRISSWSTQVTNQLMNIIEE